MASAGPAAKIARRFPAAEVTSLDLSPELIELARRLTSERNVRYLVEDITAPMATVGSGFDAIVLLDVYEHIPAKERAGVHRRLHGLLAPKGVIILTCPTPEHQAYLRQHAPEGLQPVDEDVDEAVAAQLARDIGGSLVMFQRMAVSHPNDYSHIVINRGEWGASPRWSEEAPPLQAIEDRAETVRRAIGVRMLPSGLVPAENDGRSFALRRPSLAPPPRLSSRHTSSACPPGFVFCTVASSTSTNTIGPSSQAGASG